VRRFDFTRVITAAVAGMPTAVLAHPGHGSAHDVWQGFVHPLGGLDHLLAMIAVGVIAAGLGGRALWAVPLSFIATMALAGTIAMAGVMFPDPEIGVAFSVIVLGAVIALPIRLPVAAATAMVVAAALFHGYAHGLEVPDAASGIAFGVGFVVTTALLHFAGVRAGLALIRFDAARGRQLARVGGSSMAIAGAVTLTSGLIG
jgi:urease accessory protein